jgi:SPP1 gp7 family putative phage head morphogenesis protein
LATFAEIERIVARYDAAMTGVDQRVTEQISRSLDAAYRNLERELRALYPTWQSDGALMAVQRRLLLMEQLGDLLQVVRPELQGEYQQLFEDALTVAHQNGGTMADELIRAYEPGYPLQEFTTVPIEAVVAQARDGVSRLYRYNDDFKAAVSGIVEQGLIQGWGADKLARMLRGSEAMQGQFGLAQIKSKAETIARTEVMSAFATATTERYQQNDIEYQEWQATPSEGLCAYCLARNGNIYEVGKVSIPAHPRCRCLWVPAKQKWLERGWIDTDAITEEHNRQLEELAKVGTKPNYGPTYWERKQGGLTEAPEPVWKPGDEAVRPRQRVEAEPPEPVIPGVVARAVDTGLLAGKRRILEGAYGSEALQQADERARQIVEDGRLFIRVPTAETLDLIIDAGRFKSTKELGRSKGSSYQAQRDSTEREAFADWEDRSVEDLPIYGYIGTDDVNDFSHRAALAYGVVAIELKPEAKRRATVTGSDTFQGSTPSPALEPDAASFFDVNHFADRDNIGDNRNVQNRLEALAEADNVDDYVRDAEGSGAQYIEAQVHGQVAADDIARVVFTLGERPTDAFREWAAANDVEIIEAD